MSNRIDYAQHWTDELLRDLRKKHSRITMWVDSISTEGTYKASAAHLLGLYDAAIAAVEKANAISGPPCTCSHGERIHFGLRGTCLETDCDCVWFCPMSSPEK